MFGEIHVVESVMEECAEGGRILVPDLKMQDWVIPVADAKGSLLPVLFELDRGEKHTIIAAHQHPADWVVIDERIGRQAAEYVGLNVTGTLGLLGQGEMYGPDRLFR